MKFKNTLLILLLSFSLSDSLSNINRNECEDYTTPEECYDMGCDWQIIYEQIGNELILIEQCVRSQDEDNDYSCSDVNNPFECYAVGCNWEMDVNGEGICVDLGMMDDGGFDDGGNNQNECSQFPENLCEAVPFCEWNEDLNECVRSEANDGGDDGSNQESCSDFNSPDECFDAGCEWMFNDLLGEFGICIDSGMMDDGGFDDGGNNQNECSQFPENLCEAVPFCEWNEDLNECVRSEANDGGDDGSNQDNCANLTQDECFESSNCEWGELITPNGVFEVCFELDGINPCSDFGQEDCEWFDECIWTDQGCQDYDWNFDCNPDLICGEMITCWDDGLLYPTTCGPENCDDPIGECDNGNDGPPECVLDCIGIEEIDPEEDGMGFCDWLITVAGTSGCFEDCEQEILDEIEESMIICDECLPAGNCNEYFGDNDDSNSCSELSLDECFSTQGCEPNFNANGIYEGCYESNNVNGCFSEEGEYFCIGCEWFINDCEYYECTDNGWVGPFTQDECGEDDSGGDDGGDIFEVNLKVGGVVALPGEPIEIPLYYNSQLPIAGIQFTLTDDPDLVEAIEFFSLDTTDCFQTNFNDINGSVIGIMFSLEQCVLPVNNEYNEFATIVYQPVSTDVIDWGSVVELSFSESIVSNVQGESVPVNAIGGSISFSLSGDNNFDGSINVLDVVSLINFILLVEEPNQYQYSASDLNDDNALNVLDVVLLVDLILNSD